MASIDIHICHEKYSLLHFALAPTALCSLLAPRGYRGRLLAIRSWSPRYLSEHRSLFAHFLVLKDGEICIGWVGEYVQTRDCFIKSLGEGDMVWKTKRPDFFCFSVSEPKVQVHYCYHALSVFRPSVRPSLTFHIFDFSCESAERNWTKLYRKLGLNVFYQVCVFRTDRKNKMAALASYWLKHFPLTLCNHWTVLNKIWQRARSKHPLPS